MQNVPVDVFIQIVDPVRRPGESFDEFLERTLPPMLMNSVAYQTLHPLVYKEIDIVLAPTTTHPVERQIRHMHDCGSIMDVVQHIQISGLVRWDHDDSHFHRITVPQIRRILQLATNLRALTFLYMDIGPSVARPVSLPNTWLGGGGFAPPPVLPLAPLTPSEVSQLKLRWIRFLDETTTTEFLAILPCIRKFIQSQVFWTPATPAGGPTALCSPSKAVLFDVLPMLHNPFPAPLTEARLYSSMVSPRFGENLVDLHLGANDRLSDYAKLFQLWKTLPLKHAHKLKNVRISVFLPIMHYQRAYASFVGVVGHFLRCARPSLKTLSVHILADYLSAFTASIAIQEDTWYTVSQALRTKPNLTTLAIDFIDLQHPTKGDLPEDFIIPVYAAFQDTRPTPIISYRSYAVWEMLTRPDVSLIEDQ